MTQYVHRSGWFAYKTRQQETADGPVLFRECVLLEDVPLARGRLAMGVSFHRDDYCRRDAPLALIVEDPGGALAGWTAAGDLVLDIYGPHPEAPSE